MSAVVVKLKRVPRSNGVSYYVKLIRKPKVSSNLYRTCTFINYRRFGNVHVFIISKRAEVLYPYRSDEYQQENLEEYGLLDHLRVIMHKCNDFAFGLLNARLYGAENE